MFWNKLRYLLLLAVAGFLSILYNEYHIGIIFLVSLLLPVVLFVLLFYHYFSIKAELIFAAHVVNKKDSIPITIQINNPTLFPITNSKIYITFQNDYTKEKQIKEFRVSADARTKTNVTLKLQSEFAGNLVISLKAIRIYDYLKIFSLKKKINYEVRTAVLPYYYELPECNIGYQHSSIVESDNYSPYKSGDDPSEVFAIREYREGDRLQRIHWKLSRKQGQLMIKEFSDPMNCSVLLLMDLDVPSEKYAMLFLDALLECALSLSYTFLSKDQMHYFGWYDDKNNCLRRIRVFKEKDLYEVVDGLLQTSPFTANINILSTYLAEHPNDQYTHMFYITAEITSHELDLLAAIKSQHKQVIYINDSEEDMGEELPVDLLEQSNEMGIDLWPVEVTQVRKDMELVRMD